MRKARILFIITTVVLVAGQLAAVRHVRRDIGHESSRGEA
jgi:hypothetical protein